MNILLAGLGMGTPATMTREVDDALARAEIIIGAERLVSSLSGRYSARIIAEALPEQVAQHIEQNPHWNNVCIALSGDTGFYSGAKKLAKLLAKHALTVLPGIATPVYFAARLQRPWQSWHLLSAHGTQCHVAGEVRTHAETFLLTGGELSVSTILDDLCQAGLSSVLVTVGENLSSSDEKIRTGTAGELQGHAFSSLAVMLIENASALSLPPGPAGLPDELFVRGDVPMTKQEVRAIALALLRPACDCIAYDIGAGTGAVAIELALQIPKGRVYAIERNAEALDLIEKNRNKFGVENLQAIAGTAPEALASLPAPDICFIGGSGGNMAAIISAVLAKNPQVRFLISAIAVETLGTAVSALESAGIARIDVRQISIARTVQRGKYHMLTGQNPVFLIAAGGTNG